MMGKTLLTLSFALAALLGTACASYCATLRVPEDHKKIQEAVDAAAGGDIIIAGPGVYTENIVINKNVALRSAKGPESTTIIAGIKSEPVFKLAGAAGAEVAGFTATGSDAAGIILYNTSSSRVIGNKTLKNANGILLYSSNGNTILNNAADFNERYGIYLESSNGNTLTGNSADSNGDKGLFISKSNKNVITGNSANLNTWNGIIVWASHANEIKDNKALRNTYGIVTNDSDDNDMTGNTIWPNFFIILPILLIYTGILSYLVQKNIFKIIYKNKNN